MKISSIYAIKRQVCCMANTVQWLKIQYSYFNYNLRKQPSLMILARLYGFLNGLNKEIHWNNILKHHIWLVFFRVDKQLLQPA